MQQVREHGLLEAYGRFVVTRTDQFYVCRLDLGALDPRYVHMPSSRGEKDYMCDRWLVAPRELLMGTLDILQPVVLTPEKYFGFRGSTRGDRIAAR